MSFRCRARMEARLHAVQLGASVDAKPACHQHGRSGAVPSEARACKRKGRGGAVESGGVVALPRRIP